MRRLAHNRSSTRRHSPRNWQQSARADRRRPVDTRVRGLCRLPAHRRLTRRRHRRRRQRRQQRPVRGVIVEKHHLSGGRLRPYARAEPDRKGLRNGRQPVRPVRCPVMDRHHSDRSRSETLARAAGDHTEQQCNVNAWAARPQMNRSPACPIIGRRSHVESKLHRVPAHRYI